MTPIPPAKRKAEGTDGLACRPTGVCNSSCKLGTSGYVHAKETGEPQTCLGEIYRTQQASPGG